MELLGYTFIQYAFLGGISMALLSGLVGPLVVQSRQSIASDMFAHVALAGIGAAVLFSIAPWWGALPALLIVSTLLWWLLRNESYSPDSLAMFFLSGGLALALAFVHVAKNQTFSFESYLFGSILTITTIELLVMWGLTLLVGAVVLSLWYPLLGAVQVPAYTIPYSKTPQLIRLLYFWLLAIVVWVGIKTIGGLLIGALLVIPTLTVRPFVQSFATLTIGTTATALSAVIIGLFIALVVDLPPSSLIIFTLIGLFVLGRVVKVFMR